MPLVYISLGSSTGDKKRNLQAAISSMEDRHFGTILRRSPLYEGEAIGCDLPDLFLNQAVELMTDLEPDALLAGLKSIEQDLGRVREPGKVTSRPIDLDILLYDAIVMNSADLHLPHPEMLQRLFVLKPLNDIRPELFHPVAQKTVSEIIKDLPPDVANQRIRTL